MAIACNDPPSSRPEEAIMDRVQAEIFRIVVLLLFVLIGLVAYVGTITPHAPADNRHPLIPSLEVAGCTAYKVNYDGAKTLTTYREF
jgi:hypothetical protein